MSAVVATPLDAPPSSGAHHARVLRAAALIAFARTMTQYELDRAKESRQAAVNVTIRACDVLDARRLLNVH